METLSKLPSDKERPIINIKKKAYFSDRTLKIFKKFDYTELPMIDQLITDSFVLNDAIKRDLFEYMVILKKDHNNPERQKALKETEYKYILITDFYNMIFSYLFFLFSLHVPSFE